MPTRIDAIVFQVQADGVDLTDKVQKITLTFDFQNRISEAQIELTDLPDNVDYWQRLQVSAGLHSTGGDTASDLAGQGAFGLPRFDGFITPFDFALWPSVPKINGRGPLILAERLVCDVDRENEQTLAPASGPDAYESDAPGQDLSFDPEVMGLGDASWGDDGMVKWLLDQCGLTDRIDPDNGIGGVARILGGIVPESFTWRRGASALSFIEDLDKIGLGFRCYERLNGVIVRSQTSPRTPFLDDRITFDEGADVFDDATLNRSAIDEKSRVVVTGADVGFGPVSFVDIGAIEHAPPGVTYETDLTSSPMIEVSALADVTLTDGGIGLGISCEDVVRWRKEEVQHEIVELSFSTWRDDALAPGDTIYANMPHLANINQSLWCTGVQLTVEAGSAPSFTQRITARGIAQRGRDGAPLLPMDLGASLPVNP